MVGAPGPDLATGAPTGGHRPGLPTAFRELMSRFPTGVCVVTTVAASGEPFGLTCTSLSSVTLRPPTLLVCLQQRSRTLAALRASGRFAVNLLHARGRQAAQVFAGSRPDQFAAVRWRRSEPAGLPWLVDDAFAYADCDVAGLQPVGEHVVVFGQVTTVACDTDVPLLYGLRQFSSWQPEPSPLP